MSAADKLSYRPSSPASCQTSGLMERIDRNNRVARSGRLARLRRGSKVIDGRLRKVVRSNLACAGRSNFLPNQMP